MALGDGRRWCHRTLALLCILCSLAAQLAFTAEEAPGVVLLRTVSESNLDSPADLIRLERQLAEATATYTPDRRLHRGVRELHRLVKALLTCKHPQEYQELKTSIQETIAALNNLARQPLPRKVDFFQTPWLFLKNLSRPVGRGRTPANNVPRTNDSDPSQTDPEPSTFWQRPPDIPDQDLYHGFNRTHLLLETQPLCTYAAPKESYGRNPGFEIDCRGERIKLKFAELCSEAFAARIFFALGYHTDPTDYASRVKLRYSRAMLREFNSRKPLQTHFTFLGLIPLFTLQLQQHYDPFDYLVAAVLHDGTRWSSAELKTHLFRDPKKSHPEEAEANFRPEIEAKIDYVETGPANVQSKVGKSIGPWDFGQLDHPARRELRGAALLAGWLGWFDTRFDNTRLRVVKRGGEQQLEHFFSDLGGVLGETGGLLYARGELPNAFPWSFTHRAKGGKRAEISTPFPLAGYKPIAPTPAFAAMTVADARWMARLIGSLTERQLTQALVASGFDSAQTRLYLEKLLSRRDKMIRDLRLDSEFASLLPEKQDRHWNYDPVRQGPIVVEVSGKAIQASAGQDRVVRGKLVAR